MAYLHLPAQHSTGDLVLAGQIAEAFDSQDLYVTWTGAHGAGARPTVQAVVREPPPHPLVEAFRGIAATLADVWRLFFGVPAGPAREQRLPERQTA